VHTNAFSPGKLVLAASYRPLIVNSLFVVFAEIFIADAMRLLYCIEGFALRDADLNVKLSDAQIESITRIRNEAVSESQMQEMLQLRDRILANRANWQVPEQYVTDACCANEWMTSVRASLLLQEMNI
jgi:hypothetical protein